MNTNDFERLLDELCASLTYECEKGPHFTVSKSFENHVREVIRTLLDQFKIPVDCAPHPYGFPDIVLGKFGVEVKFTTNDTWRSVANSVFESFRNKDVKHIYVVFGKMGGQPEVRWGRYEECVMHVRTSHVPRFEVDIDAKESLFKKFGITYDKFSALSEEERMKHIRDYARGRLKPGERLWWLEDKPGQGHSLPIQVQLFANLSNEEKLKMRAEASLLCPQIVALSADRRVRAKQNQVYRSDNVPANLPRHSGYTGCVLGWQRRWTRARRDARSKGASKNSATDDRGRRVHGWLPVQRVLEEECPSKEANTRVVEDGGYLRGNRQSTLEAI